VISSLFAVVEQHAKDKVATIGTGNSSHYLRWLSPETILARLIPTANNINEFFINPYEEQ